MKNMKKKHLVLLASVVLLLTFSVGGTVAYLTAETPPVVNSFTPAHVETMVVEDFGEVNGVKAERSIRIQNNGNVDAYVRAAIYGNWVRDDAIVAPWTGTVSVASGWVQGSDGYYYYTMRLPSSVNGAEEMTRNLLASPITQTGGPEGAHLVIHVIHQSIQADPASAVEAAWGVTVGADGSISK